MFEHFLAAQIADYEREVQALMVQAAVRAIADAERLELRLKRSHHRIIRTLDRLKWAEA